MTVKNEARKHKYNFVDFILIILALAIVATGAYFVVRGVVPQTTDSAITFTVEIRGVENEAAQKIAVGDLISHIDTKTYLGTVKKVAIAPEKVECVVAETVQNQDGTSSVQNKVTNVDSALYSTVTVTLTAIADTSEGIAVNEIEILSGKIIGIYGRNFAGEGKVISIYNDNSSKEAK